MKKYNYLITTLIIFLLPIFVHASCTEEEINHFEKIESQYRIEYTLNKDTGYYSLIFYNPEPEKYSYEISSLDVVLACDANQKTNTKCNGIPPSNYTIKVIGNTETCNDTLKRVFLKLKPYNKYSEDSLCDGIKDFYLCQETYDKEIDYETFVSRVNIYKESKNEKEDNPKKEIINIETIKEYVEDNLYEVIIIAIFVILVIVTTIVTIKSVKKSRRLE